MESRKMVLMSLCTGQEKRCRPREWIFGHKKGRGWLKTRCHSGRPSKCTRVLSFKGVRH